MMRFAGMLVLAVLAVGCTQGATPDCSTVMCGPDLDGTVATDSSVEASSDAADAAVEAADAAPDAPADAPDAG